MGRVGRHVGRWFPEICFESFALEFSQPSAKSFAHKSESQNTMQPARSFRAGFSQASARSFAHRIPHEMIEASFMREALRQFLLENQMSYSSHASYTSYFAIASAKHKASHCTAACKARSSVKWGCALRVVERRPFLYDSVVKDQLGSFLCHFPSAQAHLQSERSL